GGPGDCRSAASPRQSCRAGIRPGDLRRHGRHGGRRGRPGQRSRGERQAGRSRAVTDAAVTMDFYPQPAPGQAKPWAFPVPERGALGNGLTVLRCHRPGQQVVAVQICLDMPLDAEPDGLDGIAAIMMSALSEGTSKHTGEEFAAEMERCGATLGASADYPGARVSLEVPVSRLPKALGLLAEALQAPTFPRSEIERLVRNRLDEIPLEMANPGRRAARQLARELFPASARLSRPRAGTGDTVARIDAPGVRAFYQAHVRRATATAVVVGDLAGVDLDAVLAGTLGAWTGLAPSRRSCSSGGPARTGTTGYGRPWCSACTAWAARSRPGWTGFCARRRATPTGYGPSSGCCGRWRRTPGSVLRVCRFSLSAVPWTRRRRVPRWMTCGRCCACWPRKGCPRRSAIRRCRTWWESRRWSTRGQRRSRARWRIRWNRTCRTTTRLSCTCAWPRRVPPRQQPRLSRRSRRAAWSRSWSATHLRSRPK